MSSIVFDPSNANHVYAVLWQARQGPWENGVFTGPGSGQCFRRCGNHLTCGAKREHENRETGLTEMYHLFLARIVWWDSRDMLKTPRLPPPTSFLMLTSRYRRSNNDVIGQGEDKPSAG